MGTLARSRSFRLGALSFETPLFMPVGTRATVRGQNLEDLSALGYSVLLANTYHLGTRPGPDVLLAHGGVKKWMDWPGGVLTDSGGYQVFSLAESCEVDEDGARFKSLLDGRKVHLTPELSMEWQHAIGSDIRMVMDHCVPSTVGVAEAAAAVDRTLRWAKRSLEAHRAYDDGSSLFAIVQGACFPELRKRSAAELTELPFAGFAIGGLAVGETKAEREDVTAFTSQLLPVDKPRYLMGVGTPADLLEAVHRGIDMFDCILPTAIAQHGIAYTSRGRIDLKRGIYRMAEDKLDPQCDCRTCRKFSRSYLHHLVRVGECMGWQHIAHHNFTFYMALIRKMRETIRAGTFEALYAERRQVLGLVDIDNPPILPKKSRHRRPGDRAPEPGHKFEIAVLRNHQWSVRDLAHGEVMHPGSDGLVEAERLYVEQTRLKDLLEVEGERLVVWDLGLGIAANAMAAIGCWTKSVPKRDLLIVSIDTTFEPLQLATKHQRNFPHLWSGLPKKLLATGLATDVHAMTGKSLEWRSIEADFLEVLGDLPKPRLVFYDPFSHKVAPQMWTEGAFKRVYDAIADTPCELVTYSNSTSVRTALLLAGFQVGYGRATGEKAETTVAVTPALSSSIDLLGPEWLGRWERSSKFQPPLSEIPKVELAVRLRKHSQFQSGLGV